MSIFHSGINASSTSNFSNINVSNISTVNASFVKLTLGSTTIQTTSITCNTITASTNFASASYNPASATSNIGFGTTQTEGVINIGTGSRLTTGNGGGINIGTGSAANRKIPIRIGSAASITTNNGKLNTSVINASGLITAEVGITALTNSYIANVSGINASFMNLSLGSTYIGISNVSSVNASFTNTSSTSIYVTDSYIANVSGINASFMNLSLGSTYIGISNISSVNASFTNTSSRSLFVTNSYIANVSGINASFMNLSLGSTYIGVSNVSSNNGSFTNTSSTSLYVTNSYIANVSGINASFTNISVTNISATNISATNINSSYINTSTLYYNASTPYANMGTILGGTGFESLGYSCALNAAGNILAVSSPNFDDTAKALSDVGKLQIYQYINSVWQNMTTILGGETSEKLGFSCSLNAAGNILALGSPFFNDVGVDRGKLQIFQYINSTWQNIITIIGSINSENLGNSCALNAAGNIVAVGSNNHNSGIGKLQIFQYQNSTWQNMSSIIGQTSENLGISCALNAAGNILAVGSNNHNSGIGRLQIFQYTNSIWKNIKTIVGETSEKFGTSCTLNAEGNILAVGSTDNDSDGYTERGKITIFQYTNSDWQKMTTIIGSNTNEKLGFSCSLNAAGNILAVGGNYTTTQPYIGILQIYQYINSTWQNIRTISNSGENIGNSCALNAAGDIFAVGSSEFTNGEFTRTGKLQVFRSQPANLNMDAGNLQTITIGQNAYSTTIGYPGSQFTVNTNINASSINNATIVFDTLNSNAGVFNGKFGTGDGNTALGTYALYSNTSGNNNTAVGAFALETNASGNNNTAVGMYALINTSGSNNTAIGAYADQYTQNTNSSNNTAIGFQAYTASINTSLNPVANSTAIGANSTTNGFSNSTAIGYNASSTAANQIILGTSAQAVVMAGNVSSINASFVNVSMINLTVNDKFSATNAYIANVSGINASFINLSLGSTYIGIDNVSSNNASHTNTSSTRIFVTNAYIANVSGINASFINLSLGSTYIGITNISSNNGSFTNVSCSTLITNSTITSTGLITANGGIISTNVSSVNGSFTNVSCSTLITNSTITSTGIITATGGIISNSNVSSINGSFTNVSCSTLITNSTITSTGIIRANGGIISTNVSSINGSFTNVSCSTLITNSTITSSGLITATGGIISTNVSSINGSFTNVSCSTLITNSTITSSGLITATGGIISTSNVSSINGSFTNVSCSTLITNSTITSTGLIRANGGIISTNVSSSNGSFTNVSITNLNVSQINNANIRSYGENTLFGFETPTVGNVGTAFGYRALKNTTGTQNSAFGNSALQSNTTGINNIAIGKNALYTNTGGTDNSALGDNALYSNTNGSGNTAFGNSALYTNINGVNNIALGFQALRLNNGDENSAIGYKADQFTSNTFSIKNVAIGFSALTATNVSKTDTVTNSTAIGANSNCNSYSNSTAIGSGATCTAANQIMLGTISERVVMPGNLSSINASFTNVSIMNLTVNGTIFGGGSVGPNASFRNLSVLGNFSMPSTAYMNVSNASFTNVSMINLTINNINGQPYSSGTVVNSGATLITSISNVSNVNISNSSINTINISGNSIISQSASNTTNGIFISCGSTMTYPLNASFNNISVTNTITAQTFNSLSDFKLKENIIYLNEEFDLNKLKPCQFNFINSSVTKLGFIAHEVQEVVPLSVTGTRETIQSVDYSAITAASILTIKKLIGRVEYLESVLKKHNLFII